ncbi:MULTISPECIES: DUF4194 domain-containing protein [Rhodococcus]|uniref:DUF4194 domain-containing protein n=1 Tax=Rhodococcus artemisiae TaxID=714159 RepID=A0ABU7LKL2_9NOCA|nr:MULTISPECIES: DUF4194 domain-containing protein [Rhodococcus]MCK0089996.1 DUF4194 domain-containing protein [Rhodococcus sp. F64268]MEE2061452.1 DUF4194 domain-containing protein [Rhodococcus artemisiae]
MTDTAGLYPGDTGELGLDTRRALVQLLKGPLITADKHPEVWRTVIRDEKVLRSRLADVFLDLVVDEDELLAFTRPADTGDHKTPRVLRTQRLTFMDTVMILALRHRLLRAQPGERVIVGFDEVGEQLEVYRAATSTDPAGFRKRVNSSWTKLKEYSLLVPTTTEGRMEVSPVLRQLFDADQVAAVEAEFRSILEENPR